MSFLTRNGYITQRIESGTTGVGIPDLYVVCKGGTNWIELKNLKSQTMSSTAFEVSWRPGQQAWALRHYKVSGKNTWTLCALNSGFILIPMIKYYENNLVYKNEVIHFSRLNEILNFENKIFS